MGSWKSLYIYYFSGTGNAKAVSGWFADESELRGLKTVVTNIDKPGEIVYPSKEDKALIVFVYPTHGFNAVPLMLRFIASFPKNAGRDTILINTRAGMKLSKIFLPGLSGVALMLPAFMLWLKNYTCIGLKSVDLPSNWISLHPGIKQKVVASIYDHCEMKVRKMAGRFIDGAKDFGGLKSLPVDLLISPLAFGYYIGGRFFLAKTFIASEKCNNCGRCMNECPTQSIILVDGRPFWKVSCESCMRCMNNCPEKAIDTAHGMGFLFWLFYTAADAQLFYLLIKLFKINDKAIWWIIVSNFVAIAVMVLVAVVAYRIFHYSFRLKPIRQLFRITSFTSYFFWRRYKPSKDLKTAKKPNSI